MLDAETTKLFKLVYHSLRLLQHRATEITPEQEKSIHLITELFGDWISANQFDDKRESDAG